MSRAVRITVGAVVAGTLAFVALVAGVMSASDRGAGGGFFDAFDTQYLDTEYLDTYATAEVLDVDDEWDWPTVDVRWTTPDDELVVTAVDWEWTDVMPEVGDDVEVVYDSADPEWAFAADDPYVDSAPAVTGGQEDEPVAATDAAADGGAVGTVAGWVSLGALAALVVTVVLTVVAAVRAPVPAGRDVPAGPYGPPGHVGHFYPPPHQLPPHQLPQQQFPQQLPPQQPAGQPVPGHPGGASVSRSSGQGDGWSAP